MLDEPNSKIIYYRLIALWVTVEAFLGGIIHAFKLPISGLVVGSGAIICLSMIAKFAHHKSALLQATIIVCIFKLMLSPHSPIAAYFAVLFQGVLAQIIFINNKHYKLKVMLLAILCLFESGIQRILVMTIIYGKDLWLAIDTFIQTICGNQEITRYSYFIIALYLIAHVLVGILVGIFIKNIPDKLNSYNLQPLQSKEESRLEINPKPEKNKNYFLELAILVSSIALFLAIKLEYIPFNKTWKSIATIISRAILIVSIWRTILSPIIHYFLTIWLKKETKKNQSTILLINNILPEIVAIVKDSWAFSKKQKTKSWTTFCMLTLKKTLTI